MLNSRHLGPRRVWMVALSCRVWLTLWDESDAGSVFQGPRYLTTLPSNLILLAAGTNPQGSLKSKKSSPVYAKRLLAPKVGTKYLVPRTWYQVLGTKYLVPRGGPEGSQGGNPPKSGGSWSGHPHLCSNMNSHFVRSCLIKVRGFVLPKMFALPAAPSSNSKRAILH